MSKAAAAAFWMGFHGDIVVVVVVKDFLGEGVIGCEGDDFLGVSSKGNWREEFIKLCFLLRQLTEFSNL